MRKSEQLARTPRWNTMNTCPLSIWWLKGLWYDYSYSAVLPWMFPNVLPGPKFQCGGHVQQANLMAVSTKVILAVASQNVVPICSSHKRNSILILNWIVAKRTEQIGVIGNWTFPNKWSKKGGWSFVRTQLWPQPRWRGGFQRSIAR